MKVVSPGKNGNKTQQNVTSSFKIATGKCENVYLKNKQMKQVNPNINLYSKMARKGKRCTFVELYIHSTALLYHVSNECSWPEVKGK